MNEKELYIQRIRALRNKLIIQTNDIWKELGPKSYANKASDAELTHYIHLAERTVRLNNVLNRKEREDLIHIIQ